MYRSNTVDIIQLIIWIFIGLGMSLPKCQKLYDSVTSVTLNLLEANFKLSVLTFFITIVVRILEFKRLVLRRFAILHLAFNLC